VAIKARRYPRRGAAAWGSDGMEDFRPRSASAMGKTGLTRGTHAPAEDREKAPRRKA
jgi:hypothetical protein